MADFRGTVWRLGVFLAVCLFVTFLTLTIFGQFRFGAGNSYYAEFSNVSNLRNGTIVRIAGVEVGKVENISINPDATVRVQFFTEKSVVLTQGSRAVIRYDNLFGDRYLALEEGTGIPGYTKAVAEHFPHTTWAHYSTAYDGGTGGQTGFYNIMLNDNNPIAALSWWEASCAFNTAMREQVIQTAAEAPENYRYYIGTGSRHTMWGSNKVYTDTTGGVPTLVDWVNGMLDSTSSAPDPAWTNVECTNCGLLLPNDVRPNPLEPPFTQVGSDVVIQCTASPSGAFVDGTDCTQ